MQAITMGELKAMIDAHLKKSPADAALEASFLAEDYVETMVPVSMKRTTYEGDRSGPTAEGDLTVVEIRLEVAS